MNKELKQESMAKDRIEEEKRVSAVYDKKPTVSHISPICVTNK